MWRASGVNLAHMSRKYNAQNVRTMCVMQMLRAFAARNKGCYFWTPLYTLIVYITLISKCGLWCTHDNVMNRKHIKNRSQDKREMTRSDHSEILNVNSWTRLTVICNPSILGGDTHGKFERHLLIRGSPVVMIYPMVVWYLQIRVQSCGFNVRVVQFSEFSFT
jgi:hypothetical protein